MGEDLPFANIVGHPNYFKAQVLKLEMENTRLHDEIGRLSDYGIKAKARIAELESRVRELEKSETFEEKRIMFWPGWKKGSRKSQMHDETLCCEYICRPATDAEIKADSERMIRELGFASFLVSDLAQTWRELRKQLDEKEKQGAK